MKIKFIEHHGPKKTTREIAVPDYLRERYEEIIAYGAEFHCETLRPSVYGGARVGLLAVLLPGPSSAGTGVTRHCNSLDDCSTHTELLIREAHRAIKNHES